MSPTHNTLFTLAFALVLVAGSFTHAETVSFDGLPNVGARPVPVEQDFTFAILGDKTSGGEGKWPIFDEAVDTINQLDPAFVVTVGDQISGHMEERAPWNAEWAEYLEHAKRLHMPLVLIPGNHDIANVECYNFWKKDFGPTFFGFDYGDIHFLVLNTEEERIDGRGPVWQAMLEFAEKDFEAHRDARHTFVFFHKPMWDDPRYETDWARIEKAIGDRPCTIVAGHEHYLMSERRNGHLYVLQSATGGGIDLSDVRKFGNFHSFGLVTIKGNTMDYQVLEPDGAAWPVDIAPASFRKAISYEVVTLDAAPPENLDQETARVRPIITLSNVLDKTVTIEVQIHELAAAGWGSEGDSDDLVISEELGPGEKSVHNLTFAVAKEHLPYPPLVSWRVRYEGAWLNNEDFPMVQEVCLPLYPAKTWRIVPEWQVVGPFALGDIDTSFLPTDPRAANANFYKRFGPEEGYAPGKDYEGGRQWFKAVNQGRGLLNFNGIMGTLDHALGYAYCGIHAPEAQLTHAVIYSDNYTQAVLNGALIEGAQDFGTPSGFIYVPLTLKKGWNSIVIKLINNRGDWFLRALVADPQGDLEFADEPRPHNPSAETNGHAK